MEIVLGVGRTSESSDQKSFNFSEITAISGFAQEGKINSTFGELTCKFNLLAYRKSN